MVAFLGFYAAAELSHFVENCAESASASVGSKICPLVFRILYTVLYGLFATTRRQQAPTEHTGTRSKDIKITGA